MEERIKIAMYWHNGRSLGHTAEIAKISHALAEAPAKPFMAGLTGAYHGLDMLPSALDVVKLPAFSNYDNPSGWNEIGRQGLGKEALFKLRSELSETFLRHYRPDVFMVNHIPTGAEDELVPALSKNRNGFRILTLRGVLFDREKTNRLYFKGEPAAWISEHFQAITVHIDPAVFSLEENYDVPFELRRRIHYMGYLPGESAVSREAGRAKLGLEPGQRLVVASMGGGQGAMPIWRSIVSALRSNKGAFDIAWLVTGPYLEAADYEFLIRLSGELPWLKVVQYVTGMADLMAASDLFIGAAGSNMLGEILSSGCNAIVVPRQVRETEQLIHSTLLSERGILRMCSLERVLAGGLDGLVGQALAEPLNASAGLLMGGAKRYPELLRRLAGEVGR